MASSLGSSSWIFTASTTESSVSAPCISMSNAFCTARRPFALAIATGFAAQRDWGGRGRGGRIGGGIPSTALAATPPAVDRRNSRRDTDSGMHGFTHSSCGCQLAIVPTPWSFRSWSPRTTRDRKSTRLNSSHSQISYAVFCLKKKKQNTYYSFYLKKKKKIKK